MLLQLLSVHSVFIELMIINGLIVDLEKSKLCCTIFGIPSSPAGYTDDLATAVVTKGRVDKVHKIVYDYSTKWRLIFW